jgi:hypothetical protein
MAGSVKWVIYTTDQATKLAVKQDESNAVLFGFDDYTSADTGTQIMPRGFKMRKVNMKSANGDTTRSVAAGKPTAALYSGADQTVTLNGIVYAVTSTTGERAARAYAPDTGLTDGTPE